MCKVKKYISIFLCIALFITGLGFNGSFLKVYANDNITYTGTVNVTDSLSVRAGPGTSHSRIGNLAPNTVITIYGNAVSGEGRDWYKILYNGQFGYVAASYVINVTQVVIPEYDYDADFETNLSNQMFPESYKVLLRQLHATHPEWIFLADHLTMTWAEATAAESVVGKSLVQNGYVKDSWKSMAFSAYDWSEKRYISYDSGDWVTAEKDVVEYYMEPRNFLNEDGIYMFLEQSYNSNTQTKEGLQLILNGTFMEGAFPESTHATYNDVIMEAAATAGVNPYVLAASIIIEQGANGQGGSISGTVNGFEGYYNYFNINAYAKDGYDAVSYGLLYAKGGSDGKGTSLGRPWNTRAKSIIGGAQHYATGYVKRGQDNLYYKKFNVITPSFYVNQYMTNVQAAYTETLKLKSAYSAANANAKLTFSIPVFKDMPETNNTALPTSNGANNYYITALSVDGVAVENFNQFNNYYELYLSGAGTVDIQATVPSGASVSGAGTVSLSAGANNIYLNVTAASGKQATYHLSIYYDSTGGTQPPQPTVQTGYTIDSYVRGVPIGTDVATFLSNFTVTNGSAKVLNSDDTEKTSGTVCTGNKVAVYNNNGAHQYSYSIIIFGDTNSDGKVSIVDLARVQKHLLQVNLLANVQNTAADVNHDGKISILDLARVQKHLLELTQITQ